MSMLLIYLEKTLIFFGSQFVFFCSAEMPQHNRKCKKKIILINELINNIVICVISLLGHFL